MRLSDLVDDLEVPAATRVADGAWEQGVRRVRRRRTGAVAGVAFVAAAVLVVPALGSSSERPDPAPAPTVTLPPRPTPPTPPAPPTRSTRDVVGTREIGAEVTQRALRGAAVERLADAAAQVDAPTVPLAGHPLDHAVYAVGVGLTTVDVMGPDAVYRRLDLPRPTRVAYSINPLRPTSLSPSGSLLALPQPGALLIADLRTATVTSYDVGGPGNLDVAWDGDDRVLVQGEGGDPAYVVSLTDRSVTESALVVPTTYTADGPVAWGGTDAPISLPDGVTVEPRFSSSAGTFDPAPLAGDGFVVGLSQAAGPRNLTGPVVVDTTTGEPLAFLPTGEVIDPTLLLRLEGDRVVLGLETDDGVLVVRWDWRTGDVEPLLLLPGPPANEPAAVWGEGWARLEAAR